MKSIITTVITVCLVISGSISRAQSCSPFYQPPPPVPCDSGTLLASNNTTISSGQTYHYSGPATTFSNITVNGGTLVICDTVTFNGFTFNEGNVIIMASGHVEFGGYYNGGAVNHNFYNYGTTTFNLQVNLSGSSRFVFNAPGAVLRVNSSMAIFNDGLFINEGTAYAESIQLNSGASVCLWHNSRSIITNNISNDQPNSVMVPLLGDACLSYGGNFTGNQPITNNSGLYICQLPTPAQPALGHRERHADVQLHRL